MKKQSKNMIKINSWMTMALILFSLQFTFSKLYAQGKKIDLTVDDYSLWQTLRLVKLAEDGKWMSYNMHYESGMDTLFVKQTGSLKKYVFPLGYEGNFIETEWFSCISPKGLHLVNLKTGKQEIILHASKYVYSPVVKRLIILIGEKGKESMMLIRGVDGSSSNRFDGVNAFILDPSKQHILITTKQADVHTLSMMEVSGEMKKRVLLAGPSNFTNLIWHDKGGAFAFIQNSVKKSDSDNSLFYYNLSTKKLYGSNIPDLKNRFLGDSLFISNSQLKISDDLKKVFFVVQQKSKPKTATKSEVEVWNGNAKWIYPMEEKYRTTRKLALWRPFEDHHQLISNDTLPKYMLTGDQKYAILSDSKKYEPQASYDGLRDFYLMDLSRGTKELFLKKHSGLESNTIPSPSGKYITYFKEKHWWIYDIEQKSHTNITINLGPNFYDNDKQHPELPENEFPYENFGWTLDDKEVLVYDQYDIWAILPDGTTARRLTKGRETQTQFRLAGFGSHIQISKRNYDGRIYDTLDLDKGMLLESTNSSGHFGYYKWTSRGSTTVAFSNNSRLDQLYSSNEGNTFVYVEQRYDLPPRIMVKFKKKKTAFQDLQSNPQHRQFYWGKSELIEYKNTKGKNLKALLYYPAKYDSSKKYPMVVYIYEKLTKELNHVYLNPSQIYGDASINITNLTSRGYFVLAPDISYEIGDPGISATDCVVSATKEVISRGLVKPDKIGLTGHSFGGYETNFIITQTNLFATAISGSGWTEMTSAYLTLGWNTGRPDLWRFESQQLRMGKSLFEDREGYRRNSPIEHVEKITTPLLFWSGKEDVQVNWNQSIQLYVALRRLGKKHIMLLYPKEGHSLSNHENLKDLSVRIHQWFDYHLKDSAPAAWIIEGLKSSN